MFLLTPIFFFFFFLTSRFIRHFEIVDDARELLVTSGDITKGLLLAPGALDAGVIADGGIAVVVECF